MNINTIVLSGLIIVLFLMLLSILNIEQRLNSLMRKKHTRPLILIFSVLGAMAIGVGLFAPYIFTNLKSLQGKEPNNIGDTMGGTMGPFIAIAGVIFTFLAFYMQKAANDEIKEQFKIQQFESQFYEMLRLHKENVNEMEIEFPVWDKSSGIWINKLFSKREVFRQMNILFGRWLYIIPINRQVLEQDDYEGLYQIFFWGFNENVFDRFDPIAKVFLRSYPPVDFMPDIAEHNGFSSFLGHYFRHLLLMVKFVVESPEIPQYEGKMKYLKILRAQLSNYEQIMLFYNWLCTGYGDVWENENNHFFTEYKMIHNLWTAELFQNPFIRDRVNGLIDAYNRDHKSTPLFEFQGSDFNLRM